ncbi:MAG TPA: NAD(P)-dependent oxidoreductase [Polyangiaceae bacterium]|nr:NAD(P)-dependent oxidoreductase [Polyangiaceae bacterium]
MRLYIADELPAKSLDALSALGLDVVFDPKCSADDLPARIGDANILVVRSTKVTRATIEAATRLGLIVRAGAGFDTIDVAAASERGIFVSNCPGKNSVAVAELAMGLILALDRRLVDGTNDLRAGKWNKKEYGKADGLKGKTLGLAGLGRVGVEVARRARAFAMHVVAWSIPFDEEAAAAHGIGACATLHDLVERSDVVSVHLPQTVETRRLFNADVFARMKPRAIFVNTSRGGIVDEAALAVAMRERGLRVGLDVYEPEPSAAVADFQPAVASAGTFVGTHHIGASTEQAQDAIAAETVRICSEFLHKGRVPNVVNVEEHAPAECQLVVRHYDQVGVLASVLTILRNHGANVEEMSNTIFQGAKTAVAAIRLTRTPPPEVVAEIAGLRGAVIAVEAKGTA